MLKLLVALTVFTSAFGATIKRVGSPIDGRIVGGEATTIYDFPWQVSMRYMGVHNCGGSILAPNKILTAAHCTYLREPKFTDVRAGSSYYRNGGVLIGVSRIVEHESYNVPTPINNDIALLFLSSPLEYGPGIQPIALPHQGQQIKAGSIALVSGWGLLYENGVQPHQLHFVAVPLVDDKICEGVSPFVTETMICAGDYKNGGIDSCQMDSGGPFVIDNILQGVVSWGYGCAQPGYPGVYARVSTYRNWIDSHE